MTLVLYLCRLYKSLGDYDVLHGVFSRQIGTKPITREALEAEERRDYFEALRLYKEVGGGRVLYTLHFITAINSPSFSIAKMILYFALYSHGRLTLVQ